MTTPISPIRNPTVPPASWPIKRLPDDGTVDLSSKMLAERLARKGCRDG